MEPHQPPGPVGPEPRHGLSSGGLIALAILLCVSLLFNAVLGIRAARDRDSIATLKAQLDRQAQELDDLRGSLGGTGGDALARVAAAVERLRKLKFKHDVSTDLLSASALAARVRAAFLKDANKADIETTSRVLQMFGVLPDGLDLYAELLRLQSEQVAGFYDSTTKKMVAAAADATNPSPLSRTLLAHEYTHALTDQYFALSRLDQMQKKGDDDASSAFQALIEGDASYVQQLYAGEVLTSDEQANAQTEAQAEPHAEFDAAPAFLREELLFPYDQGLTFAQTLWESGGNAAVDAAYRDPPSSTEQILHPTKYLGAARDTPKSVRMPDVRAALGQGWRQVQSGEMGEFDLREILDLAGGVGLSATDASAAAAGWGGARYVALRRGSKLVVALSTVWDTAHDAQEARDAFKRWLPLRFRNDGTEFRPRTTGFGWATAAEAGLVAHDGERVLVVLGADRATTERARTAFGY